jgi:hypothetical protein
MATKGEVVKAARAKWPDAQLRENKTAAMPDQKAAAKSRRITAKQQLERARDAMRLIVQEHGHPDGRLRDTARLAVDVEGDEPSWSQLVEALKAAERYHELAGEQRELEAEVRRLDRLWMSSRFQVGTVRNIPGLPPVFSVHVRADTLDDLLGEIARA